MKQRTEHDLKLIKQHENTIMSARHFIDIIKRECVHLDYEIVYVETLAFEYTPKKQCVVCGRLSEPTEEEKIKLFQDFCKDMEFSLENKIESMKNGFNL